MIDVNDLIARVVFALAQVFLAGISTWQFVTYAPNPNQPMSDRSRWVRMVFLISAAVCTLTGLYLIVSAVLVLTYIG